jgi:hypothetical protein
MFRKAKTGGKEKPEYITTSCRYLMASNFYAVKPLSRAL